MSDTKQIIDTLTDAMAHAERALIILTYDLPGDQSSERVTAELLRAAINRIARRINAHSNALEVQS